MLIWTLTCLQWLLACLNFTLDLEYLCCCFKTKGMISVSYGSNTSSWKPWRWVRLGLIFTMRDVYINSNLNPLTKFTTTTTKFEDTLPWIISQVITNIILISTIIVISYAIKLGILFWVWWKVNGNWDNLIWVEGKPL